MAWLSRVLDAHHHYLLQAVSGLAPEAASATDLCAGRQCTCHPPAVAQDARVGMAAGRPIR